MNAQSKSQRGQPPDSAFPVGLAQPALRALRGAGCQRLEDVAALSEAQLKQLHGMGPRGIEILRQALAEKGLYFARSDQ